MFRKQIIIGLSVVCLGALLTLVVAQNGAGPGPPGGSGAVEAMISPDEREALGLGDPTWTSVHGKVHPDVYEALERQKEKEHDPMAAYQPGRPVGFQGTAYVDVYLRHEQRGKRTSQENKAAIKEVQSRVLSKLTAGEFAVKFQFKNSAGLVGYVSAAGLTNLGKDPDVVAVGLDDKPIPRDPPHVTRKAPGAKKPTWTLADGKMDPLMYPALKKSVDGYVYVVICLRRVRSAKGTLQKKTGAVKKMQDRVLSGLTADEFRLRGRAVSGGLDGYVNAAGLAKLEKQPDVRGVGLPGEPIRLSPIEMRKNARKPKPSPW